MEMNKIEKKNKSKENAKISNFSEISPCQRPFGSIQIEITDEVRRRTVVPAFLSTESMELENDYSEKFTDIIELEDYSFNLLTFLEFFSYQIAYFFLLGPFLPLIFYPFTRNMARFRNMYFWGYNSKCFREFVAYIITFSSIFGYFYLDSPNIFAIELFSLIVGGILRFCIISIKYAHFSPKKLRYIKNVNLLIEEIESEFLFTWCNQADILIDKELYTSILRNNVDSSIFRTFFLKAVKPKIQKKLEVKEEEVQTPSSTDSENTNSYRINSHILKEVWIKSFDLVKKNLINQRGDEHQKDSYSGYLVSRFLVKENKELFMSTSLIKIIGIILTIFQTLIPTIFRILNFQTIFGRTSYEILVVLCLFTGNIIFYLPIYWVLIYSVFEYDRPINLLSQLSNLLSTTKVTDYYTKKSLPTINIFCGVSYKCWYYMNKIFRSYGENFFKRIEMIFGLFLFYNLVMAILCILGIYGLLEFFSTKVNLVFLVFEMLIMFIIIFLALRKGAIINEHYDIHRDILKNNKDICSDFINLYEYYFENENFESGNEIYYHGIKCLKCYFERIQDKEEKRKKIINHLSVLINMSDDIIEQLAFSKERRPFKILGIPTTNALLKSLLAGIGTIVIAGVQRLLTKL